MAPRSSGASADASPEGRSRWSWPGRAAQHEQCLSSRKVRTKTLRRSVVASLNRADREVSRRITHSPAARRIEAWPPRPGLVAPRVTGRGGGRRPTRGVRPPSRTGSWVDPGPGSECHAGARRGWPARRRPPRCRLQRPRRPSGAGVARWFGERARVGQDLREHRAVELDQRPFELRIVACVFPQGGHGFQVARIEGIQVAQGLEVPGQMVAWLVHGQTPSSAGEKCVRSDWSARHTRTRAAPGVETPRAAAKCVLRPGPGSSGIPGPAAPRRRGERAPAPGRAVRRPPRRWIRCSADPSAADQASAPRTAAGTQRQSRASARRRVRSSRAAMPRTQAVAERLGSNRSACWSA